MATMVLRRTHRRMRAVGEAKITIVHDATRYCRPCPHLPAATDEPFAFDTLMLTGPYHWTHDKERR
jgi:hypothetical protein